MTPSTAANHNRGIILMLVAMLLFTLNDAIGKWLVASYPVGQLLAIRSFAALCVLLPLAWRKGDLKRMFSLRQPGLQLLRLILVIAEVSCFYWAVKFLPLADVFMFYLSQGIEIIRLDAIGYVWKEPETSCVTLPQTHEMVRLQHGQGPDDVVLRHRESVPRFRGRARDWVAVLKWPHSTSP